jgi:beta-1,4-N-acetylglucosaminyltransferase
MLSRTLYSLQFLPSHYLFHPHSQANLLLGAGTILDGLRIGVPLIVVPNPSLLDNHQDELAEELARQGYVVHGRIDAPNGLQEAVAQSEAMKKQQSHQWPPVNSGESARRGRGLAGVMDEEMGFLLD